MNPEQHSHAKELFLELCELDKETRGKRLDELEDTRVSKEVASLLDHHEATPEDELEPFGTRGGSAASGLGEALPGAMDGDGLSAINLASGSIVAERYRIVARLGRGGMGEVFRADDLVLGGPVALKFLRRSAHARHLSNEARLARQVTHPNVCRVFDMGELDGRPFISMEYVDGENLASLLNRIGRLPKDRTVFLARQLFSGLAAAHAKGVLHRDVKPANIMIDGRGEVRITDFGIARLEDSAGQRDLQAGTPAYMSPEQISGDEVTARSDIYSMGLVLYEMCTGQYPFEGSTFLEFARAHMDEAPPPPSSRVDDMDSTLERVILKCLEKSPTDRPRSALAVAAALPGGGDALSLAMSIGETPSPEMVAEAGSRGVLEKKSAVALLGSIAIMLLLFVTFTDRAKRLDTLDLNLPPEVLAEKAREHLRAMGWDEAPADDAFGFLENYAALMEVPAASTEQLGATAPGTSPILFWYRQSPSAMIPGGLENLALYGATVGPVDPPSLEEGMAYVLLHPAGTLDHMEMRPSYDEEKEGTAEAGMNDSDSESTGESVEGSAREGVDFAALMRTAGLDPERMVPRPAQFPPPFFADERASFTGSTAQRPDLALEVNMAGYRGKPVLFRMVPKSEGEEEVEDSWLSTMIEEWHDWWDLIYIVSLLTAIPLMRRNLRRGRGDHRGARRLAAAVFTAFGLLWLLRSPHFSHVGTEWLMVKIQLGQALLASGMVWVFYLALEPYVRRIWPHTLIAWTRLFYGRFRDPLVGRSVLIGVAAGAAWGLVEQLDRLLPGWLGLAYTPPAMAWQQFDYALGVMPSLAALVEGALSAVSDSVFSILLLVLLRLLLGRPQAAVLVYIALVTVLYSHEGVHPAISWATMGLTMAVTEAILLVRFGLVSYGTATFVYGLLSFFPITLDSSAWYASTGYVALGTVIGLTCVSAYFALQPRMGFGGPRDRLSEMQGSRSGDSPLP